MFCRRYAFSCVQHPSSIYKVQHLGKYVVIIKRQFVRDLCSVCVREQSLLGKKRLAGCWNIRSHSGVARAFGSSQIV
jgi:hypothetical protein